MSLAQRKSKLKQRQRKECAAVNKKYRKLARALEAKCADHDFCEWHKEWSGIDGFFETNILGEIILFRECKHCGKTESRVPRS